MRSRCRSRFLIYALVDPSGDIRYVGRSSSGEARPRSHWRSRAHRERPDPAHAWVREVLASGREPFHLVLETFDPTHDVHELLDDAEVAWHRRLTAEGCRLTNTYEGGKTGRRLKPMPPETVERLRAALRGVPKSEEHRRALAEAARGRVATPEWRESISRAQRGRRRPGHGDKVRPRLVGRVVSEEERRRTIEGMRTLMRPVLCLDDLIVFGSIADAARHYDLQHSLVSGSCRKGHLAGGHRFVFVTVAEPTLNVQRLPHRRTKSPTAQKSGRPET